MRVRVRIRDRSCVSEHMLLLLGGLFLSYRYLSFLPVSFFFFFTGIFLSYTYISISGKRGSCGHYKTTLQRRQSCDCLVLRVFRPSLI